MGIPNKTYIYILHFDSMFNVNPEMYSQSAF